jgi:predicted TPR repeat methyltransferase
MSLASLQRGPDAIPWLRKSLALKPRHPEAMFLLAQALLTTPDGKDEALVLLDEVAALEPDNERAKFVRAAVRGDETPPAVPAGFVRGIFDGYAGDFDHHLVRQLQYRAPQLLREAVLRAIAGDATRRFDILDLGCGTGLVGEAFKDLAATLAGVDLSPGMLAKAREKKIYDALETGDCVDATRSRAASLDLILAGDVLIYIGDLAGVFAAAASALRAGGLFAFTVETHEGSGFRLSAARRFEHSHGYLCGLAEHCDLRIISSEEVVLRKEAESDVNSRLYVLRKG